MILSWESGSALAENGSDFTGRGAQVVADVFGSGSTYSRSVGFNKRLFPAANHSNFIISGEDYVDQA